MDNFGILAKTKEIVRLAETQKVRDRSHMVEIILGRATRKGSMSPFRYPVKDTKGRVSYAVSSAPAVTSHVAFADWLDVIAYRDDRQTVLEGFEVLPLHFSAAMLNEAILKCLGDEGLSESVLVDAVRRLEVGDLDSVVRSLRKAEGVSVGLVHLRKSLRLLGELDITLRANRKKTLHPVSQLN